MSTWSKELLRKIADADDLHISPFREDGVTYGTPTWIWSVAVDSALYVRGYNGKRSRWYQAAVRQKAGRIVAAGMTLEETQRLMDDLLLVKRRMPGLTIILIEHEMSVIERITDRCVVLNYGSKIAEGTYAEVARDPQVRQAYLGLE